MVLKTAYLLVPQTNTLPSVIVEALSFPFKKTFTIFAHSTIMQRMRQDTIWNRSRWWGAFLKKTMQRENRLGFPIFEQLRQQCVAYRLVHTPWPLTKPNQNKKNHNIKRHGTERLSCFNKSLQKRTHLSHYTHEDHASSRDFNKKKTPSISLPRCMQW